MKMVSLREPKKSKAETKSDMPMVAHEPFPYGTTLELRDQVAKKCGLDDCKVGDILNLTCRAKVKSVSSSEHTNEGDKAHESYNVTLQITDLAAEEDSDEAESAGFEAGSKDEED